MDAPQPPEHIELRQDEPPPRDTHRRPTTDQIQSAWIMSQAYPPRKRHTEMIQDLASDADMSPEEIRDRLRQIPEAPNPWEDAKKITNWGPNSPKYSAWSENVVALGLNPEIVARLRGLEAAFPILSTLPPRESRK